MEDASRAQAVLPQEASSLGAAQEEVVAAGGGHPSASESAGMQDSRDGAEVSMISSWRLPSQGNKLPAYVRRSFRLKTFGLLSVQLMAVLSVMLLVDSSGSYMQLNAAWSKVVFAGLGLATTTALAVLVGCRERYPDNYVLLALVTVLVGLYWGMGYSVFSSGFHLQVAGILTVTTCTATALMAGLPLHDHGPSTFVGPLLVGWLVGSVSDLVLAPSLGKPLLTAVLAALTALFLLVFLVLSVGTRLVSCNPDDFMRVIIAMDSTLLVVVSIPLFFIISCLVHLEAATEDLEAAEAGEAA